MHEHIRDITLTLVLKVIRINFRILLLLALLISLSVIIVYTVINQQYSTYATSGAIQINNYIPGSFNDAQIAQPDNRPQDIANYGLASRSEIEEALIKSGYILIPVINKNKLDLSIKPAGLPIIGDMIQNYCQNQNQPNWLDNYCMLKLKSLEIMQFNVTPEYLNKNFTLKIIAPDAYELYLKNKYILTGKVREKISSNGITIQVASIAAPTHAQFLLSHYSLDKTINDLFNSITVEPIVVSKNYVPTVTGILKITMTGNKPKLQSQIINDIMQQLKSTAFQKQGSVLQLSISFVQQQLISVSQKLAKSQNDMVNFQAANNVISLDNQEKEYIQQLSTLEQSILENKIAINQFGTLYGNKHPLMIDLYMQKDSLVAKEAKLDSEIKKLPKNEAVYLNLKRNLDVYLQLYSFLLNKEQDINMKLSSLTSPVEILYTATDAVAPSKNTISPKVAAGVLFVILIVMLIIFLNLVFFGNSDPWHMSELIKSPLLTIIPHYKKITTKNVKPPLELIASYLLNKNDDRVQIINIGGIMSGVGKNFIITELIRYFKLLNKKCVYLNFGLNKFGIDSEYQLIDDIIAQLQQFPDKLHQNSIILKVNLLNAMDNKKMLELLSYFSKFNYVFMKSVPTEQSTLFLNLARIATENILVISPEDTHNKLDWLTNDINNLSILIHKIIYNNPKKTLFKSIYSVDSYNQ